MCKCDVKKEQGKKTIFTISTLTDIVHGTNNDAVHTIYNSDHFFFYDFLMYKHISIKVIIQSDLSAVVCIVCLGCLAPQPQLCVCGAEGSK